MKRNSSKIKLILLISSLLSGLLVSTYSQVKITDGAVMTMDLNSLLELESTNKGLLIPRVAINNLNLAAPLTAPVPAGMLVYSTGGSVTDGFYYWNGSQWKKFVQATLQINEGGTGSTTQNFVDLTTAQTIGGAKTFTGAISASNLSGTNTGDQTITLTGNVTGSGTGSFAATIANNAVTYAKMQAVSNTSRLLGSSSTTTPVQEISLGSGLSLTGTTLTSTGTGGTVTTFSSGNLAPLFTTSVVNPSTTPALSFTLSNVNTYTIYGNNTGAAAAPAFFTPVLASALFRDQGTTASVLHGNAAGNPSWGQIVNADITDATINLTTKVTGILPVVNGGTGLSSGTSGGIPAYTGATTMASSGVLTLNSLVMGGGAGATPSVLTRGNAYQVVAVNSDGSGYTHRSVKQQAGGTWGYKDAKRNLINREMLMVAVGGATMTIMGSKMRMPFSGRIVGINATGSNLVTAGTIDFIVFKNGSATAVSVTFNSSTNPPYSYSTGTTETFAAGDILDIRFTSSATYNPESIEYVAWIIIEWTE